MASRSKRRNDLRHIRAVLQSVGTVLVFFRRVLFPFALFGLVVLGLHAGSDRLDDLAFQLINGLDRVLDHILVGILQTVLPAVGVRPDSMSRWTFAAVALIDLDQKRWAARVLALVFELSADALLVWPVLRYRQDHMPWRNVLPAPKKIRNVGTVFAPLAVAFAGLAGAIVVAQQAQLQLFWLLRFLGRTGAGQAAGAGALLVLGLTLWRVAWPAVRAGLAFARATAAHGPWQRGWLLAAPLFIAALAVAPVPMWRALRGLGPW